MDYVDKFIADFMRLPETFNKLVEHKSSFDYYKAFYNASINAPFGEKYLSETIVNGFHFKLTVILEPISEEAEILNNYVTFVIDDSCISCIKFFKNDIATAEGEIALSEDNCSNFFARLEKFCQESLSDE